MLGSSDLELTDFGFSVFSETIYNYSSRIPTLLKEGNRLTELIEQVIGYSYQFPFQISNPDIITLQALSELAKAESEFKNTQQFSSLGLLLEILLQNIALKDYSKAWPYLAAQIAYYLHENRSDDVHKVYNNGHKTIYPLTLTAFNEAALILIDLIFQQNLTSSNINLKVALEELSKAIIIELLEIPFTNDAFELLNRSGLIPKEKVIHVKSILAFDSLKANLASIVVTIQAILKIRIENPELAEIADFAIQSIRRRYDATSTLAANPGIDFNNANEIGRASIITDSTYANYFLIIGLIDKEFSEALFAKWSIVKEAIYNSSNLIRLINDAGKTLEDVEGSKVLLSELRKKYGLNLTPRELFIKIREEETEEIKAFLSRFIKDSYEKEYNTIFNAGTQPEMSSDELWEKFFENLSQASNKYLTSKRRLNSLIEDLPKILVKYCDILKLFVNYNYGIYSRNIDYDTPDGVSKDTLNMDIFQDNFIVKAPLYSIES